MRLIFLVSVVDGSMGSCPSVMGGRIFISNNFGRGILFITGLTAVGGGSGSLGVRSKLNLIFLRTSYDLEGGGGGSSGIICTLDGFLCQSSY